jgi:hypothetical protein
MEADSILEKAPWLRYVLHGLGGGTAVMIGLAAIEAVKQRPEFLPQLLGGNVLFFSALVLGMVVFDRRLQSYAELHARGVTAQEQLAANVGALVAKDDERAREQDITLNYLARNSEKILQELGELKGKSS